MRGSETPKDGARGMWRRWKEELYSTMDIDCSSFEQERSRKHALCSKRQSRLHLCVSFGTSHTSAWLTDSTSPTFTHTDRGALHKLTEWISETMKAMDVLWPLRIPIDLQLLLCLLLILS